jgi:exonuclease VII large subunit
VLGRGYALVFSDEKIIKESNQVNINQELDVRFSNGAVRVKVIKKES